MLYTEPSQKCIIISLIEESVVFGETPWIGDSLAQTWEGAKDLMNTWINFWKGQQRIWSQTPPSVSSIRTRGNGHKLEHWKFHLNTTKSFCVVRWSNTGIDCCIQPWATCRDWSCSKCEWYWTNFWSAHQHQLHTVTQ